MATKRGTKPEASGAPDLYTALKWYIETDEVNEGDPENKFWLEGKERAEAALAAATMMHDIRQETILKVAQEKWGPDVQVSAPYWVDHELVRVGVDHKGASFGANFYFRNKEFR